MALCRLCCIIVLLGEIALAPQAISPISIHFFVWRDLSSVACLSFVKLSHSAWTVRRIKMSLGRPVYTIKTLCHMVHDMQVHNPQGRRDFCIEPLAKTYSDSQKIIFDLPGGSIDQRLRFLPNYLGDCCFVVVRWAWCWRVFRVTGWRTRWSSWSRTPTIHRSHRLMTTGVSVSVSCTSPGSSTRAASPQPSRHNSISGLNAYHTVCGVRTAHTHTPVKRDDWNAFWVSGRIRRRSQS